MAMRNALTSLPARLRDPSSAAATGGLRLLSDGKGRVLSEEERAKESVYVQKMEKERLEKLKKRLEQEKSGADQGKPADADKENVHRNSSLLKSRAIKIPKSNPMATIRCVMLGFSLGFSRTPRFNRFAPALCISTPPRVRSLSTAPNQFLRKNMLSPFALPSLSAPPLLHSLPPRCKTIPQTLYPVPPRIALRGLREGAQRGVLTVDKEGEGSRQSGRGGAQWHRQRTPLTPPEDAAVNRAGAAARDAPTTRDPPQGASARSLRQHTPRQLAKMSGVPRSKAATATPLSTCSLRTTRSLFYGLLPI